MGKILWGLVFVMVVISSVAVSVKADEARELSYKSCVIIFHSQHMPQEGRENFLKECMK